MKTMTRKERLEAIYLGRDFDRPAVRVWGLDLRFPVTNPMYASIRERAFEITDVCTETKAPFHMLCGKHRETLLTVHERPGASDAWVEVVSDLETPKGPLQEVYVRSTCDEPGYCKEHFVKEGADLEKILSLPYEAIPYTSDEYLADTTELGDSGIVIQSLDNPSFATHCLMGSETLAYASIDSRDLLEETVRLFGERIRAHVKDIFATGIRPIFGWVGPEVCIPPLMSVGDFEKLVFVNDKPTLDLINDAGCSAWVHCHGDMEPVLERFADMGVGVLNPIEPPPAGQITLKQAFDRIGNRIGLEGNIETHDAMTLPRDQFVAKLEEAVEAGKGRRHILGLCSGYMDYPNPPGNLAENLMAFIEEGVRICETYSS